MMAINTRVTAWTGIVALFALLASCKEDKPEELPDVRLNATVLGEVLADKEGMTLYFFSRDVIGTSACTGNCPDNWPAFLLEGTPTFDAGLSASDFATITRDDGTHQTTYRGWPLYYFTNDNAAGDVNGDGANNIWYVAKPNYSIMIGLTQLVGNDGKSYKDDYTEGTGNTRYLTDGNGRTLYSFRNDKKGKNNFTQPDFSNNTIWPIYTATLEEVPSVLSKSDFETIDVFDRKQLTYKGWPLYYFGADGETMGIAKGVSVPSPGVWPVVNSDTPEAPE